MRTEITSWLEELDDNFLAAVHAMVGTYVKKQADPIIGYEADGTAVKASIAKAQFAEDLSKPEEFITVEDFS